MPVLLGCLAERDACADPFLALSRFFCRLKSADSIVDKARRKGIEIRGPKDVSERMTDILGFRIIVADQKELRAFDALFRQAFEVIEVEDRNEIPGEFGDRGIDYRARYHHNGERYPFEIQLRTFLQHYWASRTFHFFHKKPRELALAHKEALRRFAASLADAEQRSELLEDERPVGGRRVVVIQSGEQFHDQVTLTLTGRSVEDHAAIVRKKMSLYEVFSSVAIVECACMGFLAFHLNEPLVNVPLERIGRTQG